MNKYITRGISKETNKFIFGYYMKVTNKHYIISNDAIMSRNRFNLNVISEAHFTEIKQEPDRFFRKFKNKNIWENDIVSYQESFDGKPTQKMTAVIFYDDEENSWLSKNERGHTYSADFEESDEIIGNKHGIEE